MYQDTFSKGKQNVNEHKVNKDSGEELKSRINHAGAKIKRFEEHDKRLENLVI